MSSTTFNFSSWGPSATFNFASLAPNITSVLSFLFYGVLAIFILFLILLLIHYTIYPIFSFTPTDGGLISLPTASDVQVAFNKSPAGNDVSANFVNVVPCGYSIAMDIFLPGGFVQQTVPRVLLYNAPTPVTTQSRDVSGLITNFPQANLLVWLDPTLNDLYVGAITKDLSGNFKLVTAPAIVNVPIRTPFRLAYVYNQKFLEVYINGSLESSTPFMTAPIGQSSSNPFFFGHSSSRASSMVGKVAYWARNLASREVYTNGTPAKESFFK